MEKKKSGCLGKALMALGVVFILLVIIGIAGGSGNSDESTKATIQETTEKKSSKARNTEVKEKKKEKKTDSDNVYECEYDDTTLKYEDCTITEDDLGNNVLVLYFTFTNNSNENKSYIYTYSTKAFQNGLEMGDTYIHAGQETRNAGADVQPGNSVRVASSFEYTGDKSKIDVEVQPWVSITDNKLIHFSLKFKND